MRVGIMQPYFFPYLGHFSLIAHTDHWVVFDITQYTPKTWMNRNRVLHPNAGTNWISIPLQHSSIAIKTKEACVADMRQSMQTVLGKLSHYRRKAPYYHQVEELIRQAFNVSGNSLVHLNTNALDVVCQYLGLPFKYQICSEIDIALPEDLAAGQWALEIATQMSATAYLNPASGQSLFDPAEFNRRGVHLEFLTPLGFEYCTHPYTYVPHLSILDVLMWNDAQSTLNAIRSNVEIFAATEGISCELQIEKRLLT